MLRAWKPFKAGARFGRLSQKADTRAMNKQQSRTRNDRK
jgi:hypothetical protein